MLDSFGSVLRVSDSHPEPVAIGDAGELIDVTACGVCHSDLHVVDGDIPSPLPLILGHEVTGVHHNLGPVMVYAPWGCGSCIQCSEGFEMVCADSHEAGIFADGGYAERMAVPSVQYLAPLGDLDPIKSAPLACGGLTAYRAVSHGLETLRAAGSRARALVIGAGGLGQFAISYLRLLSDAEIGALDTSAHKRATALELGAHHAYGGDDELGSFDFIIDFIGAESTLSAAAGAVARRGQVVVVGLFGGRVPFGFGAVPHEARFMSSVWGSRSQLSELLDLAAREPSVLRSPVETLPLAQAQTAHDRLRAGEAKGRQVLVVA